jgi:hypothetical protein
MKTSWLVVENGLRVSDNGLEVEIRLPWYRGLPLSSIDVAEVRINRQTIAPNAVTITVNGRQRSAEDLTGFYQENWYVLDSAYLNVPYADAKRDQSYEVQVTLVLHPPYIPGVPFRSSFNRSMRAA